VREYCLVQSVSRVVPRAGLKSVTEIGGERIAIPSLVYRNDVDVAEKQEVSAGLFAAQRGAQGRHAGLAADNARFHAGTGQMFLEELQTGFCGGARSEARFADQPGQQTYKSSFASVPGACFVRATPSDISRPLG
jgi:hypothetical protein